MDFLSFNYDTVLLYQLFLYCWECLTSSGQIKPTPLDHTFHLGKQRGNKTINALKREESDRNLLFPGWTAESLHLPTPPVHVSWVRLIFPYSWDQSRNIDAQYGSQHSVVVLWCVSDVFNRIWQLPYLAPSLQPSIDRLHHAIIKWKMT